LSTGDPSPNSTGEIAKKFRDPDAGTVWIRLRIPLECNYRQTAKMLRRNEKGGRGKDPGRLFERS
jgi:hypothetical protein